MKNSVFYIRKFTENKIVKISFIVFITFAPLLCELLDIFLELILPKFNPKVTPPIWNFDVSLLNQTLYFSDWFSILTIIWGSLKLINFFKEENEKNKWAESDESANLVATLGFCTLISYTGGFIGSRDTVAGFDTWYNIIKSIVEHWVLPSLLIIYYFLRKRTSNYSNIEFIKYKSWKNLFFPAVYFIFTLVRFYLFKFSNGEYNYTGSKTFPQTLPIIVYSEIDPNSLGSNILPVVIVILALIGGYGICLFFNYLSVIVNKKIYLAELSENKKTMKKELNSK